MNDQALHGVLGAAQHCGCVVAVVLVVAPATPPRCVTERRVADRIRRAGLKLDGHPVPDRATRATTGSAAQHACGITCCHRGDDSVVVVMPCRATFGTIAHSYPRPP